MPYKEKINHSDSFDFEDEHEKAIERWQNKIDKAETRGGDIENPEKQIAAFERWIAVHEEFRDYCESHTGGDYYWLDWYADAYERAEHDLQDYLENEYESAKIAWEESQQKKRFISSCKKKILTSIQKSEYGMARKDIYDIFPPDKQAVILERV